MGTGYLEFRRAGHQAGNRGLGAVAAFSLKVVRRENFSLLRATVFSLTKPSTD